MVQEDTELKELYRQLKWVKAEAKKGYSHKKIKIDQASLEKRVSQSKHMIDLNKIEMDRKWLGALFKEYVSVLKRLKEGGAESLEKLERGLERKELDLEVLAKKVFSFDTKYLHQLAQELAVGVDDLYLLGLSLGNPVFELYAGKLKHRIEEDRWSEGFCPICGSLPAMAYLRKDDGKRILWCQFCDTQWSFMRLKCPFCSNDDHKTLRYFFADENDARRVYVCDKCKKYLKTIDQRKLDQPEALDLGWESLSTLALDLAAQNEGFVSPYSQHKGKKRGVVI